MPRSRLIAYHPWHVERHARRRRAFEKVRDKLEHLWTKRGWSWQESCGQIRISIISGPYDVRWQVSRGKIRVPGDLGVYRAYDPVQAQVLFDYAAKKLEWQRVHGQLPHQARREWPQVDRGPHPPPWPPVETGKRFP